MKNYFSGKSLKKIYKIECGKKSNLIKSFDLESEGNEELV